MLVEFSRNIGISDPALAELLAVKEALSIFSKSEWSKVYHLVLELDASNFVYRIRNPHCSPASFKAFVQSYLAEGNKLRWEINLLDKNQNVVADILAKSGINHQIALLNFG
ncbi:hypothetical protein V6N11_044823 [Hibiscus sabdariffa]|uniref:RNase H type-1 domain-containing protein n=1 Tax=Hibiscus sabdariffa TaxID=183260 RepID=A0ABR2PU25_9ROSI